MPTVVCENIHRRITAEAGANLLKTLLVEGVRAYPWPFNYWPLNSLFGCKVEVVADGDHLSPVTGRERAKFGLAAGHLRLANECLVNGDVTIRIRP